jgi:sugar/nucleoside kinase (ribokinase family)
MKDIDVLMIGSPNIDLIVGDYAHFPSPGEEIRVPSMDICCGGGVAITAIGLARLGIRPLLLAAMNEDPFARFIRSEIEKEGVQMIVMPSSVPTGITIALDVSVDRRFITYDGSVYLLSPKDVDDERLARCRHIHLTNFRGAKDFEEYMRFVERAHRADASVSMDVGWDESGAWDGCVLELSKVVDIFFANDAELMHYARQDDLECALKHLLDIGANAVIKLGARGAVSLMGGTIERSAPYSAQAVDTTGAGDSFDAGYLYAYLRGMPPKERLRVANLCGALSVEGRGGYSNMPSESQLAQLLTARKGEN